MTDLKFLLVVKFYNILLILLYCSLLCVIIMSRYVTEFYCTSILDKSLVSRCYSKGTGLWFFARNKKIHYFKHGRTCGPFHLDPVLLFLVHNIQQNRDLLQKLLHTTKMRHVSLTVLENR